MVTKNLDESYFTDKLTHEQVGDLAWEIGEKSLNQWVTEFNTFAKEHSKEINKALKDFSILYNIPKPNRTIVVDLHHNPIDGNTNGGPRSNLDGLEEGFPIINKMGDFMYRLPNYENNATVVGVPEQTIKVLHEAQHSFFQDEKFNNLVANVVNGEPVKTQLELILSSKGITARVYANEPIELITAYLENIVQFENASSQNNEVSPLLFRADKDLQTGMIKIESTLDTESPNGPSAKFVNAWRKLLNTKLDNTTQEEQPRKETHAKQVPTVKYKDVYQLGRSLDSALANEYLDANKPIDKEFIVHLVQMAETELFA